ncbi:MAG TPA: DUF3048 domain-containing protein [Mycobacteriales bacterium]|nr:DUF3048 domain-containing protein [Mycobacteriales bacterium]
MRVFRTLAVSTAVLCFAAAGCSSSARPQAAASLSSSPPTSGTPKPVRAPRVYPLTGLPVTNAATALRPALSVKIDNVDGSFPQAGLNDADIVADCLVEGGLTRLFATFQSRDAASIGPIRSARPVDADLLRLYGPSLFSYSGAATGEIAPTIAHGEATRLDWGVYPNYYTLNGNYISPHDVFSSTRLLYAAGRAVNPQLGPPRAVFTYSARTPSWPSVRTALMNISGVSNVRWNWDGHQYLRVQNGSVDRVVGGAQVSSTNIVIMSIQVRGTNIVDAAGNVDPFDVVLGSGRVWVLRNGRGISGTWSRPTDASVMTLTTATGQVIALQPGRTWIELLPTPNQPLFG